MFVEFCFEEFINQKEVTKNYTSCETIDAKEDDPSSKESSLYASVAYVTVGLDEKEACPLELRAASAEAMSLFES